MEFCSLLTLGHQHLCSPPQLHTRCSPSLCHVFLPSRGATVFKLATDSAECSTEHQPKCSEMKQERAKAGGSQAHGVARAVWQAKGSPARSSRQQSKVCLHSPDLAFFSQQVAVHSAMGAHRLSPLLTVSGPQTQCRTQCSRMASLQPVPHCFVCGTQGLAVC